MDDLSEKLDRLLSSPDSMKRIEEMMAAFGGTPTPPADEETAPPASPTSEASAPPLLPDLGGIDLGQLLKVLPLLEQFRKEDETAVLLKALRPFLAAERQKRLDDAGQFLKIARMLPLLSELRGQEGREKHD